MLTRHFLQRSAQQLGMEPKRISEAAMAQLGQFHFPGNVRQLENICHWLTVMAPAQVIELKDLPPEVLQLVPEAVVLAEGGEALASLAAPATSWSVPSAGAVLGAPVGTVLAAPALSPSAGILPLQGWEGALESEALQLLGEGRHDVWDVLTRKFESRLILAALSTTRGRRIEAAQKLGIGRNTITRKIQELGIDD